ncbi:hypothetical protein [Craurococcus roseus]
MPAGRGWEPDGTAGAAGRAEPWAAFGEWLAHPTDEVRRSYEELGKAPGAVGLDGNGALVRRTATGGLEPVAPERVGRTPA